MCLKLSVAVRVQVDLTGIRPMPELAEVYQGVSAPKRKRVEEQPVVDEIPKVRHDMNDLLIVESLLSLLSGFPAVAGDSRG